MGYRYPRTSARKAKIKPAKIQGMEPIPEEEVGTVQGQAVGSKEEWRVAKALYQMGYTFNYQYPVFGGRIPGGQIIDFWVTSTHLPTPIYVNGRAWHSNKNAQVDDYKLYKLKKIYHGLIRPPIILWDDELPSVSAAVAVLQRRM